MLLHCVCVVCVYVCVCVCVCVYNLAGIPVVSKLPTAFENGSFVADTAQEKDTGTLNQEDYKQIVGGGGVIGVNV